MWYLLAILALVIFGPRLARAAWDSVGDWRAAGGAAWDGAKRLYAVGNNNFALGLAVGLLAGVAGVWGVGHLPNIKWPDVVPPVVQPTPKASSVVYVYEKDNGTVPSAVAVALDRLNRQGVLATAFEEDTTDGNGQVPAQYVTAKAEATKAGLPALVVQAGDKVTRVVKAPTSEQQVLEAIAP